MCAQITIAEAWARLSDEEREELMWKVKWELLWRGCYMSKQPAHAFARPRLLTLLAWVALLGALLLRS